MALLTEAEYQQTMGGSMTLLQPEDLARPFDIGGYVTSIPDADLEGYDFTSRAIAAVYRDPSERWVHVLLASATPGAHLVVVVDQTRGSVHGHHVLDLNRLYGVDGPSGDERDPPLGA